MTDRRYVSGTVRAWLWFVVAATLLGATLGFLASTAAKPTYTSHVTVLFAPLAGADSSADDLVIARSAASTLGGLAITAPLLDRAIASTGLDARVIDVQEATVVSVIGATSLLDIGVSINHAPDAATMANAIANALLTDPEAGGAGNASGLAASIVDPAIPALAPEHIASGPSALLAAVTAMILAISLGFLIETLRKYGRHTGSGSVPFRLGQVLGTGRRTSIAITVVAIASIGVGVGVVAVTTHALLATILAGAGFYVLIGFRWPLVSLMVYVILIPIEELLVVGDLGTLSRYAGIVFILTYGLPRMGRLRIAAMPIPGWAYIAWCVLSIGWAIDSAATSQEISVLLLLFAVSVMIAAAVAERPSIVRPVMWAYCLSASATALVGISAYLAGHTVNGDRVAALPGQDPAHYAALLLPALAYSLYQLVNLRAIVASGFVASVCLTAIAVSGTRGAWVSAVIVIVVFIVPRINATYRLVSIVALALIVAISLQLPGVQTLIAERAVTAVSSGGAGRTDIWSVGLNIFKADPIAGVGLGDFTSAYTPELVRATEVGRYSIWTDAASRAPHSIIIGTLGELGIVGFYLLVLFLGPLVLRSGWGPDGGAIQAALISLVISALFLDLLNRKQVWLIIGIACGLAFVARAQRARAARADRSARPPWSTTEARLAARGPS